MRNLMDESRNELEKLLGESGTEASTAVSRGRPVEKILEEIKNYKADLVVICTRGWTGLRHLLLGSVIGEDLGRSHEGEVEGVEQQYRPLALQGLRGHLGELPFLAGVQLEFRAGTSNQRLH